MARPSKPFIYNDQVWESKKEFYFHHINELDPDDCVCFGSFKYKVSRGFNAIDSLYRKRRSDYIGEVKKPGVKIEYNGDYFGSLKALWRKLSSENNRMYAYVTFVNLSKKYSINEIIRKANKRIIEGIDF